MQIIFETESKRNRTSKLWINYIKMVQIMRNFIRAERTGNWGLHKDSVQDMLPYFHAARHTNYAKSALLYLQEADDIENKMSEEEFHKFSEEGYFTIRRTDKFWSGIWSDMTIEQVLMKSLKSAGGMTHG